MTRKKPKPVSAEPPKRGNFLWEQETDRKIREAATPILSPEEMANLSPESRARLDLDRMRRTLKARSDRDKDFVESLERGGEANLIAAMRSRLLDSESDRLLGSRVREQGRKVGEKTALESREDKKALLNLIREIGPPPKHTVAELLRDQRVQKYAKGYSESTLRNWIRTLDSRSKELRKRGPRLKRNSL